MGCVPNEPRRRALRQGKHRVTDESPRWARWAGVIQKRPAAIAGVATLIMVVLEKRKEIALLKALGAKSDAVLRIFLYQGGFIGAIGTTLGLIVGFAGCKALQAYRFPLDAKVYFISDLPVEIRPNEFIITGAFAILICLVATIFPSMYAARLRPSDGLRAE